MNKYKAHIPTETYGFIEIEVEGETPEAIIKEYIKTKEEFDKQKKVADKDKSPF